jgi:peptide/nickel transport system substrate-binding protein
MSSLLRRLLFFASSSFVALLAVTQVAAPQKPGGVLKIYHRDSPASMSIHEEGTISTVAPIMGVFNNLVMYDQHVPQNSLQSIVPDLAADWSSAEDNTHLTFRLREGVKWHDGKPFTAADVKCTWDMLLDKSAGRFRVNPRKSWYWNVDQVVTNGDFEATLVLKRPQPALLALLASGLAPIYPCHVSPRDMRQHPIGTGPFQFVEFRPNESIKLTKNPDYWKQARPYLDGIEYTIIPNASTAILAFISGKFDMTWPYGVSVPLLKQVESQAPEATCELRPTNNAVNLIINRELPPFDNPGLRRALTLSLDRKALIDILAEGNGDIGGAMMPPPDGVWGMLPGLLRTLPGYDPDVQKNRDEARNIMQTLGYGPGKRLAVKVTTRNIPAYRDPATILIDQLRQIYIEGELDVVETANWLPKLLRKDYSVGLSILGNGVDDPDQNFYERYVCGAEGNVTGYCNLELDKMIAAQSMEVDQAQRKQLVWEIERKLAEDAARPIIYYSRTATCWWPQVKGLTIMSNSIYNGWRFEDVWLDK